MVDTSTTFEETEKTQAARRGTIMELELGIDTFGDATLDIEGHPLPDGQVIRNVVEEAVLADEVGLDFVGIGEHHRADFTVSAPDVVLAAVAGQTDRIRLRLLSARKITAVSPSEKTGVRAVRVTTANGGSSRAVRADRFTYK
jgi:hypothetical protein